MKNKKNIRTIIDFIIISLSISIFFCFLVFYAYKTVVPAEGSKYTITHSTRRRERVYYTDDYEIHDGVITFTDKKADKKISISNFMIKERN